MKHIWLIYMLLIFFRDSEAYFFHKKKTQTVRLQKENAMDVVTVYYHWRAEACYKRALESF